MIFACLLGEETVAGPWNRGELREVENHVPKLVEQRIMQRLGEIICSHAYNRAVIVIRLVSTDAGNSKIKAIGVVADAIRAGFRWFLLEVERIKHG